MKHKRMKLRLLAAGVCVCLLCTSAFAVNTTQTDDAQEETKIAAAEGETSYEEQSAANLTVYPTTELNVRDAPSNSSNVLGTLKAGTAVETTGLSNGWYTISFGEKTGYISAQYTTTTNPNAVTTTTVYTTERLKVRAQPNTSATVLGTLAKGAAVEVFGLSNGWYTLTYNGETGYISAEYTTTTDPNAVTTTTVYTTERLKVRAQPNTSATVLGTLAKGAAVEVYGLSNGWYTLTYNGETGYISAKYTTTTDPNAVTTTTVYTTENLRVRLEPNTTSTILGTIQKGTAVVVYELNDGWYTIKYNGSTGYISSQYTTTTKPTTPTSTKFTDVAADAWYAEAVNWAVSKGITSGIGSNKFGPNLICTRAQAVTFLWNEAGQPDVTGSVYNRFTDVKSSAWYYKAVLWAISKGITSGTSSTTFSPNSTCTRCEVVTFLWNANGKTKAAITNPFTDVKVSDWYYEAVMWAVSEGITSGTSSTTFSPKASCTRAQIVTFLYKA